jgi:hypothetical protein
VLHKNKIQFREDKKSEPQSDCVSLWVPPPHLWDEFLLGSSCLLSHTCSHLWQLLGSSGRTLLNGSSSSLRGGGGDQHQAGRAGHASLSNDIIVLTELTYQKFTVEPPTLLNAACKCKSGCETACASA